MEFTAETTTSGRISWQLQRDDGTPLARGESKQIQAAVTDAAVVSVEIADCTCHKDCGRDSHSGEWHQHEDDPCPVHPNTPTVG